VTTQLQLLNIIIIIIIIIPLMRVQGTCQANCYVKLPFYFVFTHTLICVVH